jgi:chemotaxis protein methyltransferase CheR
MMAVVDTLDDETLIRFNQLVQERTGLTNNIHRRESFCRAIHESAARAGLSDLEHYYNTLLAYPTDSPLWEDLVKSLTIGETYFFRDPEQLQALREHIFPEIIARHWNDHTLRIWSAGCATGEEAYTLAIMLRQLLPDVDQWNVTILATDLNKKFLDQARLAQYRCWSFRQADPAIYKTYFVQQGDIYQLSSTIQNMVSFSYLNLIEETYPSRASQIFNLDLILCRNVTIYLPEPVIRKIAGRFYHCLNPEGWLVLGPSESNDQVFHQFKPYHFHYAVAYKKTDSHHQKDYFSQERGSGFSSPQIEENSDLPVFDWDRWRSSIVLPEETRLPPTLPEKENIGQHGFSLLKEKRYREARLFFADFLEKEPDNIDAHLAMAQIEANSGRLPEARRWVERVIEMNPLNEQAHYLLAVVSQEMDDLKQAFLSYKKAIYLEPNFVMAHFNLFLLHQKAGQSQDAARSRATVLHLLQNLPSDELLPGADDLTAADLMNILHP